MKVQKIVSLISSLAISVSLLSCSNATEKHKKTQPKKVKEQNIKMNITDEPRSLDPRKVRNLTDINLVRMFHEGLVRSEKDDTFSLALAKSITKSNNGTKIIVHLKDANWSNGDKITSGDFLYSLKSSLSPEFPSDYAYQLYIIKNAKAVKEGTLPSNLIGVECPNDQTIIFDLEKPVPYFEKLLGMPIFFPINEKVDRSNANWSSSEKNYVCSGPFILSEWVHQDKLVAKKNEKYWDNAHVQIHKIDMIMVTETTELSMFEQKELNWVGSPFSTVSLDAIPSLQKSGNLEKAPALGTAWIRANTDHPLLKHETIRQALSYAINRKDIVEHVLLGTQSPATGIVPSSLHLTSNPYFVDGDATKAQELFEEALVTTGINKEDFSNIKLMYIPSERTRRVVETIQQQWFEILGISIQLQPIESKVYFSQLSNKDYELGYGSWIGDFNDAVNFLEVFKSKTSSTNNTNWESLNYVKAISDSFYAPSAEERSNLLRAAEEIIIHDMPVMPIYEYQWLYMQDPHLKNAFISSEGYLDLKNAVIE